MSAYYVRTKAGEKGPFSAEQLFRFVDEGKIPVTLQVIDAESGEWVVVEDLYAPSEPELEDVFDDEVFDVEDDFEEPVPEPARPARTSRIRGRRTSGFRRRRLASRRDDDSGYEEDRRPFCRSSTNVVPWVVGGVAGLVALVGGIILWPQLFGDPLLGTWVLDTRFTPGLVRAFQPAEAGESAFAREAYNDFVRKVHLTIRERTISLRFDLPTLPNLANTPYTRRRYAAGKFDLTLQQQYKTPETLSVQLKMGRLYLLDNEGKEIVFRKK